MFRSYLSQWKLGQGLGEKRRELGKGNIYKANGYENLGSVGPPQRPYTEVEAGGEDGDRDSHHRHGHGKVDAGDVCGAIGDRYTRRCLRC